MHFTIKIYIYELDVYLYIDTFVFLAKGMCKIALPHNYKPPLSWNLPNIIPTYVIQIRLLKLYQYLNNRVCYQSMDEKIYILKFSNFKKSIFVVIIKIANKFDIPILVFLWFYIDLYMCIMHLSNHK